MTYDTLIDYIKSFITHDCQCVISLKYKYTHEESYTCSNEVFSYDYANDDICWFNDWWEGQEECDFDFICNIDKLVHEYRIGVNCIDNINKRLIDLNNIMTVYRREIP